MNERQALKISEMKLYIFERDNYTCRACWENINKYNFPHLAHGISKSKTNLKKYGPEIIHSEFNLYAVCSLKCNAKMAVGKASEAQEAERIRKLIYDKE